MDNKFELLTEYILEWNEKINVTAIKNVEDFKRKNIEDSLAIGKLSEFQNANTVIDIGTGGGFPGLPLAIAYPQKEFLLVDSIEKKLKVVNDVAKRLNLANVKVLHSRAEDLPKDKLFDVAVSRAVANLSVLCEYCIPFVKKGGYFIAYKTEDAMEEITNASNAIKTLGGTLQAIVPDGIEGSGHIFVVIKKISDTKSIYPRKAGDPQKKPL